MGGRWRWAVMGVFLLSSVLNYLDRMTLAHLAPVLEKDFGFTHQDYGYVVSLFALIYAVCSPLAGAWIDRVGLNIGLCAAVGVWSLASVATGFVSSFGGLLVCRGVLAAAESAGVPGVAKAIGRFLPAKERALGHAASNVGLGIGAILAPLIATWFLLRTGWQGAFIFPGMLGLLWIPLWLGVERRATPVEDAETGVAAVPIRTVLGSPVMWRVIAANILAMAPYTLWSNWTTIFFVETHGLNVAEAAGYAAVPPFMANLGGLAGGWLSLRLTARSRRPVTARRDACLAAAVLALTVLLLPLSPSAAWSAAGVGLSFFAAAAFSVNLYTIPLDLYGAGRAAFAVSLLTSAYGVTQGIFSPVFGWMVEHWGFGPICAMVALLPALSWALLRIRPLEPAAV